MKSDEERHRPSSLDGEQSNRAVRLRPFTTVYSMASISRASKPEAPPCPRFERAGGARTQGLRISANADTGDRGQAGEAGEALAAGAPASAGAAGSPEVSASAGSAGAAGHVDGGASGGVSGSAGAAGAATAAGQAGAAGAAACLEPDPSFELEGGPCFAIAETTCAGQSGPNRARTTCFNYAPELIYEVQERMMPCLSAIEDPCAEDADEQVHACMREARQGICATAEAIAVCAEGGEDEYGQYPAIIESCSDGTLTVDACAKRLSSFQAPHGWYAECMDPSSSSYDAALEATCAQRLAECDQYD